MIWIANLAVTVILFFIAQLAHLAGWQVCLGYVLGFLSCYFLYGCWRLDDANEGYTRFPPHERAERERRDRLIDPRLSDRL